MIIGTGVELQEDKPAVPVIGQFIIFIFISYHFKAVIFLTETASLLIYVCCSFNHAVIWAKLLSAFCVLCDTSTNASSGTILFSFQGHFSCAE